MSFTSNERPWGVQTARLYWQGKAVNFSPSDPYMLASGLASPVYIDGRKLIGFPGIRTQITLFGVTCIREAVGDEFDVVAGGETAGIPYAAWIAEKMGLPMAYIRKKPKGYGKNARIEGVMNESDRVLLVEDLTTDGGSKISFADGVRDADAQVTHLFSPFYYDIFGDTPKILAEHGMGFSYLTTWADILTVAREDELFERNELDQVGAFLNDPYTWSAANGGISERSNKA